MISVFHVLRFLFISMIFFFHFGVFPYGYSAVTFFFILSGFGLMYGYGEKVQAADFGYSNFLKKRLAKVYPTHLLCLVLFVVLQLSFDHAVRYGKLIPTIFLVQSFVPKMSVYNAGNGVSWFLSDTVFFYALFPFLGRWLVHLPVKRIVKYVAWALVAYFLLICVIPQKFQHGIFYINPLLRLFDFVEGMLLCRLYFYLKTQNWSRMKSGSLFVSSFLLYALAMSVNYAIQEPYGETYNVFSFAALYWIPCGLIVLSSALFNPTCKGFFVRLGAYSFPFYMVHQLFVRGVDEVFPHVGAWDNIYLRLVVLFPICYGMAYLIYQYFEKPVSGWLKAKYIR